MHSSYFMIKTRDLFLLGCERKSQYDIIVCEKKHTLQEKARGLVLRHWLQTHLSMCIINFTHRNAMRLFIWIKLRLCLSICNTGALDYVHCLLFSPTAGYPTCIYYVTVKSSWRQGSVVFTMMYLGKSTLFSYLWLTAPCFGGWRWNTLLKSGQTPKIQYCKHLSF